MDKNIVSYIFGAVHTLERYVTQSEDFISRHSFDEECFTVKIEEQRKIIRAMRRAANNLQLETAKNDWNAANRTCNIFYGLNSMVRPEVLSTHKALSKGHAPLDFVDNRAVVH